MTKTEERLVAIETELDNMRGAIAKLSQQQTNHLEPISNAVADIAELQGALKRIKAMLTDDTKSKPIEHYGNTL